MKLPRTVDRRIAVAIAYKRIFTGTLALVFGAAVTAIVLTHGGSETSATLVLATVALAIFFGGGAWALRDGVRLRRELARTSTGA